MKRCPTCNREFSNEQKFCNVDGVLLLPDSETSVPPVSGSPPASQPPPTNKETDDDGRRFGWVEIILPNKDKLRFPLRAPETTIGSSPSNDISIQDSEVSRRHSVLRRAGDSWLIADVGSRNGTFLDRVRVGPEGKTINPGNTVSLGKSILNITLAKADEVVKPASPPPPAKPLSPVAPVKEIKPPVKEIPPSRKPEPPKDKPAPASIRSSLAGKTLDGRYELISLLAEGSTDTVYHARRVLLGDYVAVKILHPELVKNLNTRERFRRQAQVAARIHHPNSVQVYDFGTSADGEVYIVEELLSGRTLRDLINSERGLSLQRIIGIFNQMCGAVHTAHINGIVLRNINPESIFVERGLAGEEIIKVGGYGVAKIDQSAGGSQQALTMVGQAKILGKPQYMSPEQWLDEPLDSRSDVYSLGVILFELLTGEVPFDTDDPLDAARMHLNSPVPDITKFSRREIDEGIATVVTRAMAKDRNHRPPTALNLAREFQAVCGADGGVFRNLFTRVVGISPGPQVVIPSQPSAVPAGEAVLPSVVAEEKSKGKGTLNPVVMALMVEAFLSRLSSGLIKTAVPVYALIVFGLDIASVMVLVLIQNIVPLLLRPLFGTMADKYGKKKVFMISLTIRTIVSVLYAIASLPLLFFISLIRGIADSAKGPSASAMIADHTDEKNIAKAYSLYTTVKSTSGGIGEAVAAFLLVTLLVFLTGGQTVTANVAVLEELGKDGQNKEEIIRGPDEVSADNTLPGTEADTTPRKVLTVEQRDIDVSQVPIEDLPKVFDTQILQKVIITIFIVSAVFSALSLILVQIFIKEKSAGKGKKEKKEKGKNAGTQVLQKGPPVQQPNVWSFALMGALLTAPAYMVTGEFFTVLAVKLEVTPNALGWIKLIAETLVPLLFGPLFGWLADRVGAGKIIALRSASNLLTSVLFWTTPWFAGTVLLSLMIGLARGIDEIGKAAFKPTWGAIAAKVSSFNLANRSRTMGIMEGGVDASDLAFPVLAGLLLQYFSLGPLMLIRGIFSIIAEIYVFFLMRKYKL